MKLLRENPELEREGRESEPSRKDWSLLSVPIPTDPGV